MEALRAEGVCTSIGVCNFTPAALAALLAVCSVPPAVNQVERHPLLPQWELLDFCVSKRIVVQAHSPLGQGRAELLQHEVIRRVAQESGLSPAQVLLQWNLRHGVAVVPKCSSVSHATEILNSVAPATTRLSPAQMELIDTLAPAKKRFVNPPFMSGGLASSSFAW
ncbi:hypothetical protein AB1Y20_008268 [Prymnesium parvum]|uniref:NADP-dependent oxidoreductase domain-containing protein n=1 Tax=Prymnesium parvum TaxID=97485 RepID=A0AB34IW35_PRYPA